MLVFFIFLLWFIYVINKYLLSVYVFGNVLDIGNIVEMFLFLRNLYFSKGERWEIYIKESL